MGHRRAHGGGLGRNQGYIQHRVARRRLLRRGAQPRGPPLRARFGDETDIAHDRLRGQARKIGQRHGGLQSVHEKPATLTAAA